MILTFKKSMDRFELLTTWHEYKDNSSKIKAAGFRWDKVAKVWWTSDLEQASLLVSCADAFVQELLVDRARFHQRAIEASSAISAQTFQEISDLNVEPYPFQRAGIAYAMDRDRVFFADEPGLGKTLQCLATVHAKKAYPCIAIVPASLKINWKNEATAAIPELRDERFIRIVSGKKVDPEKNPFKDCGDVALWIVNYDIVKFHLESLIALKPRSVICDESHFIKDKGAQRTKSCKQLLDTVDQRYFLTGTPFLNRPSELVSQLHALGVIDLFGGGWHFLKRYCDAHAEPVWVKGDDGKPVKKLFWHFDGSSNENELQRKLREICMVRRAKDEVMKDLPPKRHQVIELAANGLQSLIDEELKAHDKWRTEIERLKREKDKAAAQGYESFESACQALSQTYQAAFCQMSVLAYRVACAKVPKVMDYCLETLEGVNKLALFAHHHDVIDAFMEGFYTNKIKAVKLTGNESGTQRNNAVTSFQDGDARVFVGSLRAAGVGLNLHRACHAVMGELDWTPGIMEQAGDRLHRIGQTDSVLITYMVLENSLDSRKIRMLIEKGKVFKAAMDDDLMDFTMPFGKGD